MGNVHAFKPKGEFPFWKILYDAIKDADYGTKFSFEQLHVMTGMNTSKVRDYVLETNKHLLEDCKKCLISVRKFGYKIATPEEHVFQARKRPKKIKNQVKFGVREWNGLNTEGFTPDQKVQFQQEFNHIATIGRLVSKKQLKGIEHTKKSLQCQEEAKALQDQQQEKLEALRDALAKVKDLGIDV